MGTMMRSILLLLLLASSSRAEFTCTAEGIFADPDHCENYIQCAFGQMNKDGSYDFIKYVYQCLQGSGGEALPLYEACDRVSTVPTVVFYTFLSLANISYLKTCEDPTIYEVDCGPRPLPDGTVVDPAADIYEDCPENAPPLEGTSTTLGGYTTDNGITNPATQPSTSHPRF